MNLFQVLDILSLIYYWFFKFSIIFLMDFIYLSLLFPKDSSTNWIRFASWKLVSGPAFVTQTNFTMRDLNYAWFAFSNNPVSLDIYCFWWTWNSFPMFAFEDRRNECFPILFLQLNSFSIVSQSLTYYLLSTCSVSI